MSNLDAFYDCADEGKVPFEHREKAKDSETLFKHKFYDKESDTSIVKAFPVTGRTHQIRVHLKSLAHPIANDQMYAKQLGIEPVMNNGGA